jgi:large conductance mechanosensitive channel
MHQLWRDFRAFLLRGNVLDLAVAVVIGVAFNALVSSLVNDVLMQLIAAIVGKPNFNALSFELGRGVIYYGRFLTALINFLIVATSLFVVVQAFQHMQRLRRHHAETDGPPPSDEVVLLGEIRDLLRDGRGQPLA